MSTKLKEAIINAKESEYKPLRVDSLLLDRPMSEYLASFSAYLLGDAAGIPEKHAEFKAISKELETLANRLEKWNY